MIVEYKETQSLVFLCVQFKIGLNNTKVSTSSVGFQHYHPSTLHCIVIPKTIDQFRISCILRVLDVILSILISFSNVHCIHIVNPTYFWEKIMKVVDPEVWKRWWLLILWTKKPVYSVIVITIILYMVLLRNHVWELCIQLLLSG